MKDIVISRAAFVAGVGAAALGLAGCSGSKLGGNRVATTADAACVDDNANITVYALLNLPGKDLVRLLRHQNYIWVDENKSYEAADGSSVFVCEHTGSGSEKADESELRAYEVEDYKALEPGGGGKACAFMLDLKGYSSGKEAFAGAIGDANAVKGEVEKSDAQWRLVSALDGSKFIATSSDTPEENGLVEITIFNEAMIRTGYISGGKAMSVDELWKKLSA